MHNKNRDTLNIPKNPKFLNNTNIEAAQFNAFDYLGKDGVLFYSPHKSKKFRIYDPIFDKWVDFGNINEKDFTKHKNENLRQKFIKKISKSRGDWRENPFSPQRLTIEILWTDRGFKQY